VRPACVPPQVRDRHLVRRDWRPHQGSPGYLLAGAHQAKESAQGVVQVKIVVRCAAISTRRGSNLWHSCLLASASSAQRLITWICVQAVVVFCPVAEAARKCAPGMRNSSEAVGLLLAVVDCPTLPTLPLARTTSCSARNATSVASCSLVLPSGGLRRRQDCQDVGF
jgi:hypothetical protein